MNKLIMMLAITPFLAGGALFGYALYMRAYIITDDAFDPNRIVSINLMFASVAAFFAGALTCRLMR